MKLLKSKINNSVSEIKAPQKSKKLFFALLIGGIALGYVGFAIGGILSLVILLGGVAFVIAGFMQIIGVSECVCPNCETKGFVFKYAKEYKCKSCNTTSCVVEKE